MALERISIESLPKYMQRRPEIRALTLQVYPDGPRCFKVPGTERIYDVTVVGDSYHCSCTAAISGAKCAHALAVKRYLQETSK